MNDSKKCDTRFDPYDSLRPPYLCGDPEFEIKEEFANRYGNCRNGNIIKTNDTTEDIQEM